MRDAGPMRAPVCGDIDRIMQVMEAAFDPTYGEAWNRQQLVRRIDRSADRPELGQP